MTNYTVQREQGAKLTRDIDGKIAPAFGASWVRKDAAKATRLDARTFSQSDVAISEVYGCEASDLFL